MKILILKQKEEFDSDKISYIEQFTSLIEEVSTKLSQVEQTSKE
jgi:hypothetical protein